MDNPWISMAMDVMNINEYQRLSIGDFVLVARWVDAYQCPGSIFGETWRKLMVLRFANFWAIQNTIVKFPKTISCILGWGGVNPY